MLNVLSRLALICIFTLLETCVSLSQKKWGAKADFPGTPRVHACAFVIGNKAYFGTGRDASGYRKIFGSMILLKIAGHRKTILGV